MNATAKDVLREISEISDRKKRQLQDDLKKFKAKVRSESGQGKRTLEDAIEATELSLQDKPVPDRLRQAIFKALELVEKE